MNLLTWLDGFLELTINGRPLCYLVLVLAGLAAIISARMLLAAIKNPAPAPASSPGKNPRPAPKKQK